MTDYQPSLAEAAAAQLMAAKAQADQRYPTEVAAALAAQQAEAARRDRAAQERVSPALRQQLAQAASDAQTAQGRLANHERVQPTRDGVAAWAQTRAQLQHEVHAYAQIYQHAAQQIAQAEQHAAQQVAQTARQRYDRAMAEAERVERDGMQRLADARQALFDLSVKVKDDIQRARQAAERLRQQGL